MRRDGAAILAAWLRHGPCLCRAALDTKAAKLEAEDAGVRAAMGETRIELDARTATCAALERNMETAHLETEQLLAQQVRPSEP